MRPLVTAVTSIEQDPARLGGQQQVGHWRPARLQVHGGQSGPHGPAAAAGELAARLPLAGEGLDHPDVAQHLGGLAGQGGVGVPGSPLDGPDAPPPQRHHQRASGGTTASATSPRVRSTASTTTTIPASVSTSGTSTVNHATIESSTRATSPVSRVTRSPDRCRSWNGRLRARASARTPPPRRSAPTRSAVAAVR